MDNLQERIEEVLADSFCNEDHETYEGCLTCEKALRKIIRDMQERIKELEKKPINWKKNSLAIGYVAACDKIKELEAQLPEGMKCCTILFKKCEVGHGRLTAVNWTDNGCHWCKIKQLEAENTRR